MSVHVHQAAAAPENAHPFPGNATSKQTKAFASTVLQLRSEHQFVKILPSLGPPKIGTVQFSPVLHVKQGASNPICHSSGPEVVRRIIDCRCKAEDRSFLGKLAIHFADPLAENFHRRRLQNYPSSHGNCKGRPRRHVLPQEEPGPT
jgi:hypothetical protein